MIREIPRVLAIYDVDLPTKTAQSAISFHFRKHRSLRDERLVDELPDDLFLIN